MVYPVIPIFLVSVLNAPVTIVGLLIEGIAESIANLLRIFSGYFSDRSGKRKPLIVFLRNTGSQVRCQETSRSRNPSSVVLFSRTR